MFYEVYTKKIYSYVTLRLGLDSQVGTKTSYGLDGPGIESR
jgi:hypothetical protein